MYCILIDAHLSDGDRLATLDVFPLICLADNDDGDRLATLDEFPLMGIDLFKVSTRIC